MLQARWLNLVLILTSRIYEQKQQLTRRSGFKAIFNVFNLIFLELLLSFVSLPLYVGMKSSRVTAYLEEKSDYTKINFDYNLRRILTLTSVSVIFFIWLVKLLLIILAPVIFGPIQLYSVSDLKSVDLLQEEVIMSETGIQTAKVFDEMIIPELTKIDKLRGGDYRFYGIGQPQTKIVLLISDSQTIILVGDIDDQGEWQVDLVRDELKLSEGNHSILAFGFDEEKEVRSQLSYRQYFKSQDILINKLLKNSDIFINSSITIIIILGIFLTILTL
ncbi:hypothetical protein GW933_02640 [Candidatus Falkowbacteria bacterium]|uniref:Uncharacterized protein n=1 Tax=Candidatus Buchananbacteria bacterium CG10_big_fil_rev_8_21_14_0_10_33_19 TaxID=1974525 RepID=A0A2H0W4C1_9BACT|nr:hypothetical protein [Candidatus Falkowbacteria bacterium]PIS06209.1 MAG: hypothetical protein COT80_01395 [Candidatus Buchananbacteria bacterium CG10_big_fil_rev_8_21_14_0_10_33_19]